VIEKTSFLSSRSWLLGDHLGSTSMVTDASGVIVSELRYSAFGETRYQNGTLTTDYLYTGQRQETEIGLYYYVARWYDPAIGRFVQADSIVPDPSSALGFDRYAYTNNNPVKYTDPSGHRVDAEGSYNPWNETVRDDDGIYDLVTNTYLTSSTSATDYEEDVNTNEITGFVIYGEAAGKLMSLIPVPFFSSVSGGASPIGVGCILKGPDAGLCTYLSSVNVGGGVNLPGIAEGSVNGGLGVLLNTYELKDLEGLDFEVGVEFDIQEFVELGVDLSYSWAYNGEPVKDYKGDQIGSINIEFGGGVDLGVPGIDASIYGDASNTSTWGIPLPLCRVIAPSPGYNPSCPYP